MADNFRPAQPVCYLSERSGIGECYLATTKGPPLQVKPYQEGDDEPSLVMELEDLMKVAARQNFGIEEPESLLRVCMHLADARKLCCHLIHALAASGDKVAIHLEKEMMGFLDNQEEG